MDNLALMQRAASQFSTLADGLGPEDFERQTPCTEWKVRDLLVHVANGGQMFATILEQGSISDEEMGRIAGTEHAEDPRAAVTEGVDRFLRVASAPGVQEKTVTMPFGPMPGSAALGLLAVDVTTHSADLARATGQQIEDTELVEQALGLARQMIPPQLRRPGFMDAEQEAAADAPAVDRLLAFTGRRL